MFEDKNGTFRIGGTTSHKNGLHTYTLGPRKNNWGRGRRKDRAVLCASVVKQGKKGTVEKSLCEPD